MLFSLPETVASRNYYMFVLPGGVAHPKVYTQIHLPFDIAISKVKTTCIEHLATKRCKPMQLQYFKLSFKCSLVNNVRS